MNILCETDRSGKKNMMHKTRYCDKHLEIKLGKGLVIKKNILKNNSPQYITIWKGNAFSFQ